MHLNALKDFKKPVEIPTNFFKICKGNQIYAPTDRKKEIKSPERNQNISKKGTKQLILLKLLKTQILYKSKLKFKNGFYS